MSGTEPEEVEPEAPPTGERAGRRAPFVLAGLAAVFLLTTIVFGVLAVGFKADRDEAGDERTEVATTAGQVVEALFTFDPDDPEAATPLIRSLATGIFLDSYESNREVRETAAEQFGSTASCVVKDVYVGEVSGDGTAEAIVRFDVVTQGAAGTNAQTDLYVTVQLVRGADGWKVNVLDELRLNPVADPPAGAVPTTEQEA